MNQPLVFTVIATDKPGIVSTLAQCVKAHGGNWLDSRMSQLAGEFAGIVHVSIPLEKRNDLETALKQLAEQGIEVTIKQSGSLIAHDEKHINIEVFGNDRAGIVAEISRLFSEKGINIVELDTDISEAPVSGGELFHADAVISIAKTVKLDELQDKLHELADALALDIEWTSRL